jgi:hypothetical protein
MGGYLTVFDATGTGPFVIWSPLIFGVISLMFTVALWFKREAMMPNRTEGPRLVIATFFVLMAVMWTGLSAWRIITQEMAISKALREKNIAVAEGVVSRFKPQFGKGEFPEKFCVGQKCFSYFDFLPGPGFHATGTIEPNLRVRAYYTGNTIIRLDIVPAPKRPPAGPPSGDGTE